MTIQGAFETWKTLLRLLRPLSSREGRGFILKAVFLLLIVKLIESRFEVENLVYDRMAGLRALLREKANARDSNVVVVKLDTAAAGFLQSDRLFAAGGPFPRDVLAKVLEAVASRHPRLIVLDIALSSRANEEQDRTLSAALARVKGTVLLAQDITSFEPSTAKPEPLLDDFLANAASLAAPSFFVEDEDGAVRNLVVRTHSKQLTLPALAAAKVSPGCVDNLADSIPLCFHTPAANFFRSFSAQALLAFGKLPPQASLDFFQGHVGSNTVVVIGPFFPSSQDIFRVPRWVGDERGAMRGSYLLAYGIHTLLARERLSRLALPWTLCLDVALGALGFVLVLLRFRWPKSGIVDWRLCLTVPYGLLCCLAVFWPGWLVPMVVPIVAYTFGNHLGGEYYERFGEREIRLDSPAKEPEDASKAPGQEQLAAK